MNKKLLIPVAAVVLLLILVGGGVLVMSSRNKSKTEPVTTKQNEANKVQETQVAKKSLKDLLAAGIPQKCTFKDLSNDVDMEGTSYVANGKVRGDFKSSVNGETSSGHSIFDGKTSYVWMDGTSTGFKMEIDPAVTATPESSSQQGVDLNKTIDYNCSAWIPDQSLFNPPENNYFFYFLKMDPGQDKNKGNIIFKKNYTTCPDLSGEFRRD